jgi:5-methyltetrahydrofolate--homocysteine methyltransferase
MAVLDELRQAIISGDHNGARSLAEQGAADGLGARSLVVDGVAAAMEIVGEKYRSNEYFLPELLLAQRAMKAALSVVSSDSLDYIGTVVIGTVKGDLHDIGKNLVAAMLEGAGFKVIDLGVDVSPAAFVEAFQTNSAQLVAMSALLTTTMGAMQDTIRAFEEAGLRDRARIIIGGAPVTQAFAEDIEADGHASDAARAVEMARSLLHS